MYQHDALGVDDHGTATAGFGGCACPIARGREIRACRTWQLPLEPVLLIARCHDSNLSQLSSVGRRSAPFDRSAHCPVMSASLQLTSMRVCGPRRTALRVQAVAKPSTASTGTVKKEEKQMQVRAAFYDDQRPNQRHLDPYLQ